MINYTLWLVLEGVTLLGIISGCLGVFVLLRQQSLLGDAISHAAFPGIVIMFLCTYSTNPWILLTGGACAGMLGATIVHYIIFYTTLKKDAILGIVLSVFFGIGLVLLSIVQKLPNSQQAVLNKFLFGNAATLLPEDIVIIKVIGCVIFCAIMFFWKECSLYMFDPVLFRNLGFSSTRLEIFLTLLIVLAIIISLQTVGVVLTSTMLIAPAAAARQWTTRISSMMFLAAFFGLFAAFTGVYASNYIEQLPTGPTIVVILSSLVIFSLCFSPQRGMQ